jgi:hypothetical protein
MSGILSLLGAVCLVRGHKFEMVLVPSMLEAKKTVVQMVCVRCWHVEGEKAVGWDIIPTTGP